VTLLEVLSCIGQAATTGVRQGDYLSHVNGWAVPGLEGDLDEAVSRMGAERPLRLRFRRVVAGGVAQGGGGAAAGDAAAPPADADDAPAAAVSAAAAAAAVSAGATAAAAAAALEAVNDTPDGNDAALRAGARFEVVFQQGTMGLNLRHSDHTKERIVCFSLVAQVGG
jgi:hypothetical protein